MVADECRIQQEPNSCYRWNLKAHTPVVRIERERKSISVYGGLSQYTTRVINHFCLWQESKETVAFLEKIKQYRQKLIHTLHKTAPILLVWDGARWHRSKKVKQWLTDNPGIVELMRFPAYSPELNPQERVWKALKKHLFESLVSDDFDTTVKKAKQYLRNRKFNYTFY